jgi:hypothetical protein
MKRLAVGVLTILAVAPLGVAQDLPKSEIFGGYSLEHISACDLRCASFVSDGHSSPANYNGWNASLTSFVHKFVGFTVDFSGHCGTTVITGAETLSGSTSRYSYMFGPVAAFRKKDYSAFAHALLGGVFGNFGKFSGTFGGGFTAQGYTEFNSNDEKCPFSIMLMGSEHSSRAEGEVSHGLARARRTDATPHGGQ